MAVKNWPLPTSLKQQRGFLELAGYYRFVQGYGAIARPLTNMLKKNHFHWPEEAKAAFQSLEDSLIQSPVLALPDFSKEFVIGSAFISRVLNRQQQSLFTYEK